ncbi:4Fe-4S binding protein, partial [Desulfococcaceae bacterium OttesenSCG-928-F15]|nr:4Fe-4S binding protein [Desulfococcaceae bacterium OttesenSCG-928-F15]
KIIKIDEEKCDGCGLCADACHEGAIVMEKNKAKLLRDDYCDGLGDCLPVCPTGAITFEEREAAPYDEEAVQARMAEKKGQMQPLACGCPGVSAHTIMRNPTSASEPAAEFDMVSELKQWPVQIKLVPVKAPYFKDAKLLIAADCTAYAYANFHGKFMKDRITLVGCPKLDEGDYSEKLTAIIRDNEIKSVTLVRMVVPVFCFRNRSEGDFVVLPAEIENLPAAVLKKISPGRL